VSAVGSSAQYPTNRTVSLVQSQAVNLISEQKVQNWKC